MADFASRVRGPDEAEPIAARAVALLGENFHDVAAVELVAKGDNLAVHFGADALVADFRVDEIGEIDGSRAGGKFEHAALGSEGVHLGGSQVHLERRKELTGLLKLLGPFNQLAHPDDALVVAFGNGFAVLVFPVGGDALFGDAVHLLSANLNLEGLAAMNQSSVERLIEVGTRHGDVVLEAAGDGAPDVMDDAKRSVTIALRIGDDADRQKIVNLFKSALLPNKLSMERIKAFDAGFELGGNSAFHEFGANRGLNLLEESLMNGGFRGDFLLQSEKTFRLEDAEGQIFQLIADQAHSQAMGDGRVDIQGFTGDALLLFRLEEFDGAHVVEPVGQFDDHDADVVHHGKKHLADVFGLARFGSDHVEAADLGDALDQARGFRAEAGFDAGDGEFRVLNDVVKKRGRERGGIHAQVRQDVSHFEEVGEIRLAGFAELAAVALGGDFVGAADEPRVVRGAILFELGEQFLEARVEPALGAVLLETQRQIGWRGHASLYAGRGTARDRGAEAETVRGRKRRGAREERLFEVNRFIAAGIAIRPIRPSAALAKRASA